MTHEAVIPNLHLATNLELKPRVQPSPSRATFASLGLYHLDIETRSLLGQPKFGVTCDNERILALADVTQIAGGSLDAIHTLVTAKEKKAITDNSNQYVRDNNTSLALKVSTIEGHPPDLSSVRNQVKDPIMLLNLLLYIAERRTQEGMTDAPSYLGSAVSTLAELNQQGYPFFPWEISKGFQRTGILTHDLHQATTPVFDLAENWLSNLQQRTKRSGYYAQEEETIAYGMIKCNQIKRALNLARQLSLPGVIGTRNTRNKIYAEAARHYVRESEFAQALDTVGLMTKGARYPLMVAIYGDMAINEAAQNIDPQVNIDYVEQLLKPSVHQKPPILIEGHLRVGRARFIYGDYSGAETSWQAAWRLASNQANHLQASVAETLDDVGYNAELLFCIAMQPDGIPEAAVPQHQMKILQTAVRRNYVALASLKSSLDAAKPNYGVCTHDITDLAKVELQKALGLI